MSASEPGWDRADFRCGRCSATFSATSPEELNRLRQEHADRCMGRYETNPLMQVRDSATFWGPGAFEPGDGMIILPRISDTE